LGLLLQSLHRADIPMAASRSTSPVWQPFLNTLFAGWRGAAVPTGAADFHAGFATLRKPGKSRLVFPL
jgi:hypothetical protein